LGSEEKGARRAREEGRLVIVQDVLDDD